MAPFPDETYLLPHYHHLFAAVQAHLYAGAPEVAWQRIQSSWRGLKQSRLLMTQCNRVEIRHLRARTAVALAAATPPRRSRHPRWSRERLLKIALSDAATIENDHASLAKPFAATIRAAVAHLGGRHPAAIADLQRALTAFEAAGMKLYASATRAHLGALLGETAGKGMRSEAHAWMRSQSVVRPDAMSAMLLPGLD